MDTINSLGGLLSINQWFVWRLTWDEESNKFTKVPCYPDGSKYRMDASDPANWQTLAQARATLAAHRARADGYAYTLGFYLTASCGYWFFDIDECVSGGQLSPLAQGLCSAFPGAAWEWSSSGRGLHIFGRGHVPEHRRKGITHAIEFYNDKRGIAFGLSGQFHGNADLDFTPQVAWLVENYFPPTALAGEILDSEFDKPHPSWHGPEDDDELITRIRRGERMDAQAVFTGVPSERATFSDLFDGNTAVLERAYAGGSDMDYALIGILSFWTGRDAIRTERIMRRSALYRDKWESARGKDTYIRYSILRQFRQAHAEQRPVYGARNDRSEHVSNVLTDRATGESERSHSSVAESTRAGYAGDAVVRAADSTGGLVTITFAPEGGKYEASKHYVDLFNAARTGLELEAAARQAQLDPRMTDDLAFSLGLDLQRRFAELQIAKRVDWCRSLVTPPRNTDAVPAHRPYTEFGNAARLIDKYGDSLMYVGETAQWYRWDEYRWQAAMPEEIQFLAGQSIADIMSEAEAMPEDLRGPVIKWAMDSQKVAMIRNMIARAQHDPHVFARSTTLDADLYLLGCPNGAIDLRTGELLAPDRTRRITQCVAAPYEPSADCPWFKQTIREAFFDDLEQVMFFKRLMGYTLLADPKEQKLIIPWGGGANGKSTILNAITATLGDYSAVAAASTFVSEEGSRSSAAGAPREDLVRLRGTRFLAISEIDENAVLREGMVKSLTGDDIITARGINAKQSIQYKPRFVPVMPTNHRPIIKGDDNGIWRRILLVPFERNFETDPYIKKDEERAAKIATERSGILRWLVEGAIEYTHWGLCVPERVQAAKEEYRDESDLLREWTETCLEFDPSYVTPTGDIFKSWVMYAQPKGMLKFISTQSALSRKLTGRSGFRKAQHMGGIRGRVWIGVRLRTSAMPGSV